MNHLLEAFFFDVDNSRVFDAFFEENYDYISTIRSLCVGGRDIPSEGVYYAQSGAWHILAFLYRVGDVHRCGYVYNEESEKCYVSTFGRKICVAAMEALEVLANFPPASFDGMLNKKMLMMRKKDIGWAQFFWKNKKPMYVINSDSAQFPPAFCNDAASRLLCAWGAEELCNEECKTVFEELKDLVFKYYTRVTQYPGIGLMRTYVNDATDMHVLFCALDGEHIIVNHRQEGIAVISCFEDTYTCVTALNWKLSDVRDKVMVESPIMADVAEIAKELSISNEVAIRVYSALPEKSRADFLSNLKHSFER